MARNSFGGDGLESPAGTLELGGRGVQHGLGVDVLGIERTHVQLSPEVSRDHIGRGVLPDAALGAGEPTDVKAVQLEHVSGIGRRDVRLSGKRPLRLGRGGISTDERQPLAPGGQPGPSQHVADATGRDVLAQCVDELCGDTPRSEARLAEGQGDDLLLEPRRDLVGHARRPALAGPQDHQPVAQDERPPVVIGRAVEAELAARATHANLFSAREKLQAMPIDEVIIGHGAVPFFWWLRSQKDGPLLFLAAKSNLSGRLVGCSL